SSCPTREPQLPAMGCAPSTVQDDFEHVATSAVITKTEQVSATAEVSERLEDAISTEAGDEEDNDIQVRIEVVIPEHLKTILFGHVVDGPAAFEEGTSSWSVHAAWNRARPIPKHIVLKPDRSMHDKHVQRIDRFRLAVECNPDRFADMVDTRRASVSQQTARHDSKFDREAYIHDRRLQVLMAALRLCNKAPVQSNRKAYLLGSSSNRSVPFPV
ncbi:unnamed protein product, partial [Symbiodinium microadriaticum]